MNIGKLFFITIICTSVISASESTPQPPNSAAINQENYEKNVKEIFQNLEKLHQDYIRQDNKPVVLMFSNSRCKKCELMMPIINELTQELTETHRFIKFTPTEDFSIQNFLLLSQHHPESVPTFIFMKDGIEKERTKGCMDKESFRKKMDAAFEK